MKNNKQHYYTEFPDVHVKINAFSESLRRHLYIFKTTTGVFSYNKIDLGTKVLIENMIIPRENNLFLDLGCGYGPIGMVLAFESLNSIVYMIDINQRAIWCARENIKINLPNNKKNVITLTGNYFKPIKNKNLKFNGIYMNPPLRQGRKPFLQLIHEIPKYLTDNGSFQFVIKKKMGAQYIFNFLSKSFPHEKIEILCKRSGYWVFRCFNTN